MGHGGPVVAEMWVSNVKTAAYVRRVQASRLTKKKKKEDRVTVRSRVVSNPATEHGPMLLDFCKWTGTGMASMV